MLTIEEYNEKISKSMLTEEEQKNIKEMEDYFKVINKYKDYASEETRGNFTQYENSMYYLGGVPEENQTPNMKNALNTFYEISNTPSVLETRKNEQKNTANKAMSLERKRQKTAGYTNGIAILFVVFNIGLFLATLLLYMR